MITSRQLEQPSPDGVGWANKRRNAQASAARLWRWRSARHAARTILDRHVQPGARVAIVGAGNGHDLPLGRIARRAAHVDLIDLDPIAARRARRRLGFSPARARVLGEDVTAGAANQIVRSALTSGQARVSVPDADPIGAGPYDIVIGDLLYTQLLYPALADCGLDGPAIDAILLRDGQRLTDAVVARLHASAPDGLVAHFHDVVGWWPGHKQPFTINEALNLADHDPDAALHVVLDGTTPHGCDPRRASLALGATVVDTSFWRWPFRRHVDYLVCASVMLSPRPGREAAPAPDETT